MKNVIENKYVNFENQIYDCTLIGSLMLFELAINKFNCNRFSGRLDNNFFTFVYLINVNKTVTRFIHLDSDCAFNH